MEVFMADGFGVLILTIFSTLCLIALFIGLVSLFPKVVERTKVTADLTPGRSFVIGLINLLFFGSVAMGFAAIGEGVGANIFLLPALVLLILLTTGLVIGLTGLANLVGERIKPEENKWRQTLWGAVVLTLGSLTPFIGWFGLFLYLSFLGLGAFILSWFQRPGRDNSDS
jgi:hypothetical protein